MTYLQLLLEEATDDIPEEKKKANCQEKRWREGQRGAAKIETG